MKVAVVGGGIAGLAAARRLEALGADPVLVERDGVLGGKIRTEHVDGLVVETAPDSFLARKERGVGLCEELGLGDELIARRPEHARTFVRRGDAFLRLPEGLTGMIPTDLAALESGALLSPEGLERFRAASDPPVPTGAADESGAAFVARRFGRETYDALVEPLMTGIYGGDGERMSLRATFPQLRSLELEHGSLLRGLAAPTPSGRPAFLSLRDGMGSLVARVVDRLERTRLVTGVAATDVARTEAGYEVALGGGESIAADGVVVAVPAYASAELLQHVDPELAELHAGIPYASSVVVSLAFAREDVVPLDGYGYLVPRAEGSDVLACTWSSQKWDGRAPDDFHLVRVYAGRFGGRDLTLEDDDVLVALAREELLALDVSASPTLARVHRWPLGMPQYVLGPPERIAGLEERLAEYPGLAVAGAAYRGVGIPDCIASGERAAEQIVASLEPAAHAHSRKSL